MADKIEITPEIVRALPAEVWDAYPDGGPLAAKYRRPSRGVIVDRDTGEEFELDALRAKLEQMREQRESLAVLMVPDPDRDEIELMKTIDMAECIKPEDVK